MREYLVFEATKDLRELRFVSIEVAKNVRDLSRKLKRKSNLENGTTLVAVSKNCIKKVIVK